MCAKKSGAARRGRDRAGAVGRRQPEPAAVSAFEAAARDKGRKRKFPLLGQKAPAPARPKPKGEAGSEARSRKKALLVEYKGMRKANRFVDRRFGGALPRCCTPLPSHLRFCPLTWAVPQSMRCNQATSAPPIR